MDFKNMYIFFLRFFFPKKIVLHRINDKICVFIHINKNGGTSISKALGMKSKKHLSYKSLEKSILKIDNEKLIIFTVIRNPFDRVVSLYNYRLKNNNIPKINGQFMDFNLWVEYTFNKSYNAQKSTSLMLAPQVEWLKDSHGEISKEIYFIRFENLDDEFNLFLSKKVGIQRVLTWENRSSKKIQYRDIYTEKSKLIVSKYFSEDIVNFKYTY